MNQAQQDEVRSKLGVNIRRRREELGLSQEQLANRAEMGAAHLGNIERGSSRNNPTLFSTFYVHTLVEGIEQEFQNCLSSQALGQAEDYAGQAAMLRYLLTDLSTRDDASLANIL